MTLTPALNRWVDIFFSSYHLNCVFWVAPIRAKKFLFLPKIINIIYPKILTAINSPKATKPAFNQNGSCRIKYNSAPTINPFSITGTNEATNSCFMNIINKQLNRVAAVPKIKSHGNNGELIFAKKQPSVRPMIESRRKKHSNINASASLICMPKYEMELVAIVNTQYIAAIKAFIIIDLVNSFSFISLF